MANVLEKQIVEEGFRNAVVKLTGYLDTSDITEDPAVLLSDFTNNDPIAGPLTGFRVDHISFAISLPLELQLYWSGSSDSNGQGQQIVPLSGRGKIDATDDGGFIPNKLAAGYTGNITLKSSGYQQAVGTVQNFSLFLRLVKLYAH